MLVDFFVLMSSIQQVLIGLYITTILPSQTVHLDILDSTSPIHCSYPQMAETMVPRNAPQSISCGLDMQGRGDEIKIHTMFETEHEQFKQQAS